MRQGDELTESHACGVGLQVLDLSHYSSGDAAGSVAGSLAVVDITATQRCLLVGLRNGRVITYRIAPFPPSPNTPAEVLIDATVRRPGESPVTFVASRAPMGPAILALLQERTLFAKPSSGSPVWRRLCLQGEGEGGGRAGGVASHAAPFCCEACPFGYARVRVRLGARMPTLARVHAIVEIRAPSPLPPMLLRAHTHMFCYLHSLPLLHRRTHIHKF